MKANKIRIALLAITLATASAWAGGSDEVVVTRQLAMNQRNTLPDKTLMVETKQLSPSKNADENLVDAIHQVMDTIAKEDYQNRTFVLLLEPKPNGGVAIAVHNDDIVTRYKQNEAALFGSIEYKKCHFAVLIGKNNKELLERTFKRHKKMRFVQEFEFVQFPTPRYPTSVIANWTASTGIAWHTVVINDEQAGQGRKAQEMNNINNEEQ